MPSKRWRVVDENALWRAMPSHGRTKPRRRLAALQQVRRRSGRRTCADVCCSFCAVGVRSRRYQVINVETIIFSPHLRAFPDPPSLTIFRTGMLARLDAAVEARLMAGSVGAGGDVGGAQRGSGDFGSGDDPLAVAAAADAAEALLSALRRASADADALPPPAAPHEVAYGEHQQHHRNCR